MKRAAKGGALQAVTANLLASGAVAFRTPAATWSRFLAEAEIARDTAEAEALLAAASADAGKNIVVEPYLIDVTQGEARIAPKVLREAIRTSGPTIEENAVVPPPRATV